MMQGDPLPEAVRGFTPYGPIAYHIVELEQVVQSPEPDRISGPVMVSAPKPASITSSDTVSVAAVTRILVSSEFHILRE